MWGPVRFVVEAKGPLLRVSRVHSELQAHEGEGVQMQPHYLTEMCIAPGLRRGKV